MSEVPSSVAISDLLFASLSLTDKPFVYVPNFGGCQGRRTGVGVTTVSNSLILGGWVTKVLKNGDEK